MKVITDKAVNDFLNKNLNKKSLLEQFQPALLSGLVEHARDPHKIVPPRIAQASNNPDSDTTHIYMPCISPKEVGIKVISGGPGNNTKGLGFQGCVLIMNEITGVLEAVLNANTLTAFRTALASSLGLTKVIDVHSSEILPELTVFGVGLQAYWHVKLTLALYEGKITTVNILNRTLKNAEILKEKLSAEFGNIKFNSYSYEHEASGFIPRVQNSSIIFGCTPATTPIIKQDYLNKDKKFPKFISLIGSYKPHMIELDLQLCKELKANGVSIIVDSKEHTLHEAGELIQAGYTAEQLIEIQQLYEPQQLNNTKITEDSSNITVQKIVGLSIMDLSMGKLITHAITNEDSVYIEDF
ncbi:uncharacterized protein SPAPADRAFT_61440 [Spathaspora passalidarum NRRL Y-27907]|uniref:Ornithine cyclodeaminase n=1 Tax=Spathaspora passalidarum (strain NRRL Y-27907 / 11-Y1) TaxID=619300 RepID=G3AMU4_SPAPN|nr:uncharacterized protein SPAPADRAFT_61440 [Spathaspora passalidarum NRRL Y-27907]EGW32358.1 hypothetical protein SPAPADRAFT_61440 [Spathaspora passalidarum NRRL Y-27907]